MKSSFNMLLAAALTMMFVWGCNSGESGEGESFAGLSSETDTISYAIGMDIGKNFSSQNIEVTPAALKKGLEDQIAGTAMFDQAKKDQILQAFNMKLQQQQRAAMQEKAAANKQKGASFLAENSTKEGVITLPSGLQYKVVTPGTGKSPTINDMVKCNYRGTLIDGTEFDSSYSRGEPATFPLKGVIQAWQIAVPLMKEGGKWEIYAPSDLAYGDQGSPPTIGPGETLIFTIELLEINPPMPQGQPGQPQR